ALLSHTGPMTRTVRDAALMLNVLAGPDDRDAFSLPPDDTDYLRACEGDICGLRVAWSPTLGYAPLEQEVPQGIEAAARVFSTELGCELETADPGFENPLELFMTLWVSGLGTYLQDYLPEWKDQLDPGLIRLIEPLPRITTPMYCSAMMKRAQLWDVTR